MNTADPTVLRLFEIVGTSIAFIALWVSLRQRSAFYLGLYVACLFMVVWDWIFNMKWFFNVHFDDRLAALWTIQGEDESLAAALAFIGFYFFALFLLVKFSGKLDAKLGKWQWPVLYLANVVYVIVFEAIFVGLGVWTYYQRDGFELAGMAWSNSFFNAHLMLFSYALLRLFRRWMNINDSPSARLNVRDESFWKQAICAFGAVHTAFFTAFTLQLGWYITMSPWADGPRAF